MFQGYALLRVHANAVSQPGTAGLAGTDKVHNNAKKAQFDIMILLYFHLGFGFLSYFVVFNASIALCAVLPKRLFMVKVLGANANGSLALQDWLGLARCTTSGLY
jgi:hypothetical protein